jgi:hypothetical protein
MALVSGAVLWPGLGTTHPDTALPAGFAAHRGQFEFLITIPIATVIAAVTAHHLVSKSAAGSAIHRR